MTSPSGDITAWQTAVFKVTFIVFIIFGSGVCGCCRNEQATGGGPAIPGQKNAGNSGRQERSELQNKFRAIESEMLSMEIADGDDWHKVKSDILILLKCDYQMREVIVFCEKTIGEPGRFKADQFSYHFSKSIIESIGGEDVSTRSGYILLQGARHDVAEALFDRAGIIYQILFVDNNP